MLKSIALLLSVFTHAQFAHADVAPMNFMSDYKVVACVNPEGEDANSYPFAMYVKRYREDGLFTYLQFNSGTFGIKRFSISDANLILEFSAARVGQMANDERLQERLVVNPHTRSADRIQDINGKVSQHFAHCKLFNSEDRAPMVKWVKSLKPTN